MRKPRVTVSTTLAGAEFVICAYDGEDVKYSVARYPADNLAVDDVDDVDDVVALDRVDFMAMLEVSKLEGAEVERDDLRGRLRNMRDLALEGYSRGWDPLDRADATTAIDALFKPE